MLRALYLLGEIVLAIMVVVQGFLALLQPKRCIEIFQAWCRYLNWEVAPIRLDKEIRNTRILGGLLIFLGILIGFIMMLQLQVEG